MGSFARRDDSMLLQLPYPWSSAGDSLNMFACKLQYELEEFFQYLFITFTSFLRCCATAKIHSLRFSLSPLVDPLFSVQYPADESSDFNGGRVG